MAKYKELKINIEVNPELLLGKLLEKAMLAPQQPNETKKEQIKK